LSSHSTARLQTNADEDGSWNSLSDRFETARINHEEACNLDDACSNWAESRFSRMRRIEIGHHHVADAYLLRYAHSWREDSRRISNGISHRIAALALQAFCGFWRLLAEAR
jgi:hypothetical protein